MQQTTTNAHPRDDEAQALAALVQPWPDLTKLVGIVVQQWPEHARYLRQSMAVRSPGLMSTSNAVAAAVLKLADSQAAKIADDYRWLCARIQEEEIEFARTGHYRYSTFEQALANVYSDDAFMERYMHGLLLSHALWFMHASSLHFFRQRLEPRVAAGGRVLEVGPGHGLLLYLALTDFHLAEAHGWDLSEISLAQTRAAMARLGAEDRARFVKQDMNHIALSGETFDLVILSHILEHLDAPVAALESMRPTLGKAGQLFVNVPLNAPMPDHIILLRSPDEACDLLRKSGYQIVEMSTHTTQAVSLSRALRRQVAVTCSIIAEPA